MIENTELCRPWIQRVRPGLGTRRAEEHRHLVWGTDTADGQYPRIRENKSTCRPTILVSGSFGMSAFEAPLICKILARHLHLQLEQNRSRSFQSVLDLLAEETAQPGIASSRLISCLYESLFVYAIRAYASTSAAPPKGWLAAMSDQHLSKAIQAMHSYISRSWSVASLAREARMSRSAFALKFRTVLGQTPLEYLTHLADAQSGGDGSLQRYALL